MIARISTGLLDGILTHAAETPGAEVCGLLFGADGRIGAVTPAANIAADPARRFEIDPQALFAAIRAERTGGPSMMGHYHSHPSGDTTPSACDAAMAEPGRLWLIVGRGRAAAWHSIADGPIHGAFQPIELVVTA